MVEDPTLRQAIRVAMRRLLDGVTTVQELSDRLLHMGCTGKPDHCADCPLAVYFTRELTHAGLLRPGDYVRIAFGVGVRRRFDGRMGYAAHADMPQVMHEFIALFDERHLPELIACRTR